MKRGYSNVGQSGQRVTVRITVRDTVRFIVSERVYNDYGDSLCSINRFSYRDEAPIAECDCSATTVISMSTWGEGRVLDGKLAGYGSI